MTDRDHFAAAALTGLLGSNYGNSVQPTGMAILAYQLADAMLRERDETYAEKTSGSGSETLSDEEREAVEWCRDNITAMAHPSSAFAYIHAATLRNLLERLHT